MNTIQEKIDWHHAPVHLFSPGSVYMVTGATLHKRHFFPDSNRLKLLETVFFEVIEYRGWELKAWALFSNHYHFMAKAPERDGNIGRMIQHFHSEAAKAVNRLDDVSRRQVLYEYWDKCLTFEKSYYPRLNYVMNNPVRHGLVPVADQYPFCSAGWFANNCASAFRRKVASFKYDHLKEKDEFEPVWDDN